jgi:hypothetical protein
VARSKRKRILRRNRLARRGVRRNKHGAALRRVVGRRVWGAARLDNVSARPNMM